MRQCLIYLKELFFSASYRKSIWFFITLWVLTFLLSDEISYSGLYYLILLVATIVLLFEKCGVIDSEKGIRKRFLPYFYVIFFLCMIPTLAVNLAFSAIGISHYDTNDGTLHGLNLRRGIFRLHYKHLSLYRRV